jgi:hypothetical protein
MIFVTIVGLVITLAFAMFMTSTVLVEERAVEGEVAKTRAYWAEMGNFHYALSRISKSKFCSSCVVPNKAQDSVLATNLQSYFNELTNYQTWTYPDEASGYTIRVTETASTAGGQNFSGWLQATSSVSSSARVSGLAHLPIMHMGLCVGLPNAGAKCGNISGNNGGNTTAYFSVNMLDNLPG